MFRNLFIRTSFVISAIFVLILVTVAVFAVRENAASNSGLGPPLQAANSAASRRPTSASNPRNLALQPEAAKLSRRLGQRFIGGDSGVSVLIGEVITREKRVPVRVVRTQDKRGESVEITTDGKVLAWNPSNGHNANAAITKFDREVIERIIFDSADAFVLAQLQGASYQVIGKNVRADIDGADGYDGPLWTVVRLSYPRANDESANPVRVYYINSRTGLIDKVITEVDGEEIEATLDGWISEGGETFPSVIRWTTAGQQSMEFKVINFVRPNAR